MQACAAALQQRRTQAASRLVLHWKLHRAGRAVRAVRTEHERTREPMRGPEPVDSPSLSTAIGSG